MIVQAGHRRDPLSVVSPFNPNFSALVFARCADNETFKAFESRLKALVSRSTAHGTEVSATKRLLALMLIKGADVKYNQRMSNWVASVMTMHNQSSSVFAFNKFEDQAIEGSVSVSKILSTSDYPVHVRYASLAPFLQQSDGLFSANQSNSNAVRLSTAIASTLSSGRSSGKNCNKSRRPRMDADASIKANLTQPGHLSGQLCHLADAHNTDR